MSRAARERHDGRGLLRSSQAILRPLVVTDDAKAFRPWFEAVRPNDPLGDWCKGARRWWIFDPSVSPGGSARSGENRDNLQVSASGISRASRRSVRLVRVALP